jgi:endo-1,4-beta-xylanase
MVLSLSYFDAGASTMLQIIGDFNGDGKVDGLDFIAFRNEWGNTGCSSSNTCHCDMNEDGKVNGLDFIIFRNNWGKTNQ